MIDKTYISSIAPYMEAFIKYKHSLGWKYETSEYYLREFDRYYAANETEDFLLKDIIKKWIILRDTECSNTQRIRVATIREFGKYLQLTGYSDSYIIPKKVCQKQTRTIPHFFTNDEIVRFFYACDTLRPRKENLVRHLVLPMLYRFLYCCGVRTCEARLLKRENANLTTGYIDIFNSKGLKNRRIFITEELKKLYMKYDTLINEIYPGRIYFFPIKSNGCYSKKGVSVNFNKIWKAAGLGNKSGSKARAYDFRHHFAFANLNRWIEKGIDVNSMLPYLMRYMGHSSLESTFYYLHLVPEFFATYSDKTKSLEGLLPEVEYDEEK